MMIARYTIVSSLRQLVSLVLLGSSFLTYTESCSRRSTPKPRTPSPTLQSNGSTAAGTQHSAIQQAAGQPECPRPYHTEFCLNGGTCFSIQLGDSPPSINCQCTAGWTGRRCELKDLPDNYFVKSRGSDLKGASLHSGVVVIVIFVVIVIAVVIIARFRWRSRSGGGSGSGGAKMRNSASGGGRGGTSRPSSVGNALRHAKIFSPKSYENLSQTGKESSPDTNATSSSLTDEKLQPHR